MSAERSALVEDSDGSVHENESGSGCTAKKCLCACCACCCLLFVILAVCLGIIAATFTNPDVDVVKTELKGMTMTQSNVSFHTETTIWISNPNNWPITGEIQQLTAKVYSLDKNAADEVGQVYFAGRSGLPYPVALDPQSNVTFILNTSIYVKTNDPSFAYMSARLQRDCGPLATRNEENKKTTKIRVVLADIKARVAFISADLSGKEVPLELEAPCDAPPSPNSAPAFPTLPPPPTFFPPAGGPTTTTTTVAGGGNSGGGLLLP